METEELRHGHTTVHLLEDLSGHCWEACIPRGVSLSQVLSVAGCHEPGAFCVLTSQPETPWESGDGRSESSGFCGDSQAFVKPSLVTSRVKPQMAPRREVWVFPMIKRSTVGCEARWSVNKAFPQMAEKLPSLTTLHGGTGMILWLYSWSSQELSQL
jgi:hypothetical protein